MQNQRKYKWYKRPRQDLETFIIKKKDMDSFDEFKNEEETHSCPMTYHEEKQVINLTSKFIYNELFHIYKKIRQGFN